MHAVDAEGQEGPGLPVGALEVVWVESQSSEERGTTGKRQGRRKAGVVFKRQVQHGGNISAARRQSGRDHSTAGCAKPEP